MRGPNMFKLGVFSANCDGGLTMSLAPERWHADWDDIAHLTRDRSWEPRKMRAYFERIENCHHRLFPYRWLGKLGIN